MFLVGNILGSVLWGILIALALTAIVLLLVKGMSSKDFTPLSLILAGAMLVALGFQSSFMMGAFKVKHQVNRTEQTLHSGLGGIAASMLQRETWDDVSDLVEVAGNVLDDRNFDARDYSSLECIRAKLNSYILYRVLWMLGILVVGGALVALTMGNSVKGGYGGGYESTSRYDDGY